MVWQRSATTLALTTALTLAAAPARAGGGTIKGQVTAKRAKYRKNAVVYLEKVPGVHAPPAKPLIMDQRNHEFDPFILPLVRGTQVDFLNDDNTNHNVFSPDGEPFNLGTFGKGEKRSWTFRQPGVYTLLCKLHPSMIAYVLVLQNPFFSVTGKDGVFRIEEVPAGEYTVKVWHERRQAEPATVKVTGGATVELELKLTR